MKTLEYSTSNNCCGDPINDMMVCPSCKEHTCAEYLTEDGDELTELQVWAVDTLAAWKQYADAMPALLNDKSRAMMMDKTPLTIAQLKAIVSVCDIYGVKHNLYEYTYSFAIHVDLTDLFTVTYEARRDAVSSDPKSALFAA